MLSATTSPRSAPPSTPTDDTPRPFQRSSVRVIVEGVRSSVRQSTDAQSPVHPVCRRRGERRLLRHWFRNPRWDSDHGLRRGDPPRSSPDVGLLNWQVNHGNGFRESHVAFSAPDSASVGPLALQQSPQVQTCFICPVSGRSTPRITTGDPCATPAATTSKRSAALPNSGPTAHRSGRAVVLADYLPCTTM